MLHQANCSYRLEHVVARSSKQGTTSSDDFSCLGTTRTAVTSGITTLSDYRDSSEDTDEAIQDFSLDGNEKNRNEHPYTDLKCLRENITKVEKENGQLKGSTRFDGITG